MLRALIRKALLLCAIAVAIPTQASPYSPIYVFGDSLSDNGNISDPAYRPPAPYVGGRFSNGPVAVEYLASQLGAPLFDYAVGGATTGLSNPDIPTMANSGILSQVTGFAAGHPSGVDPNALYMIWGGPNDFLNSPNPADAIAPAVTNIVTEVGILKSLGAVHIFVPNMVDLGTTPSGSQIPGASILSAAFDAALSAALPADVVQFDTFSLVNDVVANPGLFGFTNVTDPCFDGVNVCADPSKYLFWDDLHPTTKANQLLAARFASALPEPSSVALAGFGLAGLGWARRRRTLMAV